MLSVVFNFYRKIKLNLEDKIQQKNEEFQQSQSQSNEYKIEDQIEIRSKNYYGKYTYKIPLQFKNIDQENQFYQ
ncbi:unnamed protein product [Paramecium pentaurelia]|uniref:Uncharacterized protein n=1 Tax=Paramecium pentaurelia TaxID=43138 RepID=A0A8S1SRS2_9CILI|nr:unnamed protein product [Paramecium pentaurelia]